MPRSSKIPPPASPEDLLTMTQAQEYLQTSRKNALAILHRVTPLFVHPGPRGRRWRRGDLVEVLKNPVQAPQKVLSYRRADLGGKHLKQVT